jgi:hypothetical protein
MKSWFAIRLTLILLILAAALWLGLKEGLDGLRDAVDSGQQIAAACQVVYGACAGMSFTGIVTRRPWVRLSLSGWAVFVALTAALSTVYWGGGGWGVAALSGIGALVVALLIVWGARAHLASTPPSPAAD